MGEPQWASGHPTLLLATSKLLRSGGKRASAFIPASAPLNIPGHLLEGTSILPSNALFLGPPESPSAPLAPPTTPTLHCMACPPQHTYRGPLTIEKAETASGAPHLSPLPLNPQTGKKKINKFRFLVDT